MFVFEFNDETGSFSVSFHLVFPNVQLLDHTLQSTCLRIAAQLEYAAYALLFSLSAQLLAGLQVLILLNFIPDNLGLWSIHRQQRALQQVLLLE